MQIKFMRSFSIMVTLLIFFIIQLGLCEQISWDCAECGRTGNTGNYCGGCGHPSPWIVDAMLEDDNEIETETQEINIGDIITFGHYEQDNNIENGSENIEWIVLDVQDGKTLLISRYGLDVQPYNTTNVGGITWEKCTLRQWMNTTFLSAAFSSAEQLEILLTDVDNSSSQGYSGWDTWGGNDTQDRLFLLSYAETNHYFTADYRTSSIRSRVAPSAYAKKQGAGTVYNCKTEDEDAAGGWWLRSPGYFGNSAAIVHYDGSIDSDNICIDYRCVRPALWINLESDVWGGS